MSPVDPISAPAVAGSRAAALPWPVPATAVQVRKKLVGRQY